MMNEQERQKYALELIQQYISFGYRVHPLNGWSKSPKHKGWQTTRYDAAAAQTEWATTDRAEGFSNVALQALGLIVIDLDRVKDSSGEWQENPVYTAHKDDWFKSCPLQRSGSGGLHAFFKHPKDKPVLKNSVSSFAPGVDIRTSGGQCVLSPSRYADPKHPECRGNVYQWVRPLVPMSALEEIPADLYDELHKHGEQQAKKSSSPLVSKKKLRKPNKKLTEKLSRWIAEDTRHDDDSAATCHLVMRWLLKAFDSSVKHDCVSETFVAHPYIRDWLDRHPSQAGSWQETVQHAYDIYATPENCLGLEKPRLPVRLLSGFNCKVSPEFETFVEQFEIRNDLTLNRTVCGELEYLVSLPAGKRNYELLCGGGKSLGSTALVLHRQDMRFLMVKEKRSDLIALKDFLNRNGEASVGLLTGFDPDACIMERKPNRWEVYDRATSPCRSCQTPCAFGKTSTTEGRNEQTSKRVLLITHKMFLSLLNRGLVESDRFVFVDEGLKSVEDFNLTPEIEKSLSIVFPLGGNSSVYAFRHINHLREKTLDGSCYYDRYDCLTIDGDDYIEKLRRFCFKKHRRVLQSGTNTQLLGHLENALSWFCFLQNSDYRAAMKTSSGIRVRSGVMKMNIPNPVVVLDGSSSISRTLWRDFEIFRSSVPLPEYSKTVIHAIPANPTKKQLVAYLPLLKKSFVEYVQSSTDCAAWLAVNKNFPEVTSLLEDLTNYFDVTLTRGIIIGSNRARHCQHAMIAMSVFSDVADYALGAALHGQRTISGMEIYNEQGTPAMNPYGFVSDALQREFQRQYCDELMQTIMRGIIRSKPGSEYHAFCFLSSEIIAANLLSLMPGARVVDATGGSYFGLIDLMKEQKPQTLQDLMELADVKPDDAGLKERCKLVHKLFAPAGRS